jgi:hypothetical protein
VTSSVHDAPKLQRIRRRANTVGAAGSAISPHSGRSAIGEVRAQ